MPSVFTLEGPHLGSAMSMLDPRASLPQPQLPAQQGIVTSGKRLTIGGLLLLGIGAAIGIVVYRRSSKMLSDVGSLARGGFDMLKTIAREARSPEEYARRAEAWNAAEAKPLPDAKIAKAYRKKGSGKVARLIREAREARMEGRERLWTKMSRGLKGLDVTEKQQRMFKRGVDAMRRAMKGSSDAERAFGVAIRGSKDPDFATGVRTAFNLVSSKGDQAAAQRNLVKYGFKSG